MALSVPEAQAAYKRMDLETRARTMARMEWELLRSNDPIQSVLRAVEAELRGDPMPSWGEA